MNLNIVQRLHVSSTSYQMSISFFFPSFHSEGLDFIFGDNGPMTTAFLLLFRSPFHFLLRSSFPYSLNGEYKQESPLFLKGNFSIKWAGDCFPASSFAFLHLPHALFGNELEVKAFKP